MLSNSTQGTGLRPAFARRPVADDFARSHFVFMLGSLLITIGIVPYLVVVVRDLRERRAL